MKKFKLFLILSFIVIFGCQDHTKQKPYPILNPDWYNVAFLITDGVYNTELTAPFDIFQHTKFREDIKAMNTFTVSNKDKAVITFEGLSILPDYNFMEDDLPEIDILVVPSTEHHLDTDLDDENLVNWVRATGKQATWVTSHCDGAFLLAKAGLLDSVASTTFPADVEAYREMFPQLDIRDSVLFVHDEKYITSAGGAKSFEAALYLTEVLYGAEVARKLAKGLVIEWDLNSIPHTIITN